MSIFTWTKFEAFYKEAQAQNDLAEKLIKEIAKELREHPEREKELWEKHEKTVLPALAKAEEYEKDLKDMLQYLKEYFKK